MTDKVTVFIAEDEELARAKLRNALAQRPEFVLVGEAADGESAVRAIERLRPRLLLLDVQMPGLNGFEVLNALTYSPRVVFTTAHDEYAIKAFEVHSIDYLLKPYSNERLFQALDRAMEANGQPAFEASANAASARQLTELLRQSQPPSRLACRKKSEIYFIAPADVIWFESADTITFAHTATDKLQIGRTLEQLEQELAAADFVRTHRAALVNVNFIRKITPLFNGTFEITAEHVKAPIPLSRRCARDLRERFPW